MQIILQRPEKQGQISICEFFHESGIEKGKPNGNALSGNQRILPIADPWMGASPQGVPDFGGHYPQVGNIPAAS
jgi:hypothetical protein